MTGLDLPCSRALREAMTVNVSGERWVVTGGAGFIGSHVVDALVRRGVSVVVVDDFSVGRRSNVSAHRGAIEIIPADVRDQGAMRKAIRGADVVIHMAVASLRVSLNDPWTAHEVNATGTLHVCQAALEAGTRRLVYVSSSEAYGSASTVPMNEDHPLQPTTVYGASKAAGELYALAYWRTYGMPVCVVRPFNTYGPREHAHGTSAEVIPRFAYRALGGHSPVIFGDGRQTRDFTWVGDTAAGIVAAADARHWTGESVNIARGEEVSILDVCHLVLKQLGREDLSPEHHEERPGDVLRHYADVSRAATVLGFSADVGIHDGVQRYVSWLVGQGPDVAAWSESEEIRNW